MDRLTYTDLRFLNYGGNQLPSYFKFDKRDNELIEFYNDDAKKCEEESVSKVIDVFYKERFVAYYAFTSSEIRATKLNDDDKIAAFPHPSLKLGRLLVCGTMRNRGIGTCILQDIGRRAMDIKGKIPLRFLTVDALPHAVDFYRSNGFIDSGVKHGSGLSVMYIDLKNIL